MQFFADAVTTELLIHLVAVTMGVVLDKLTYLTKLLPRLALINRDKHGFSGDLGESLDVRVDLCLVILQENHG